MRRPASFFVSLFSLFSMVACSSGESGPPSPAAPTTETTPTSPTPSPAKTDDPEEKGPPFVPSFPRVESFGGPVIKTPKIVPIVFAGDPFAAAIDDFDKKLAKSTYWQSVAPEYGVGALTAGAMVTLAETAPKQITADAIESWLVEKLSTPNGPLGAADPDTLYAVFYPATTTITMGGAGALGQSCEGYGGYHSEISVGGKAIGYAVLPRCSDMSELTVATSHEIYEWATDPFPATAPAYAKLDDAHWAWQATMIGELSDLCTFLDRDPLRPADLGYDVQRHWSNKLSLAGHLPCAPEKKIAYTQAVPETNTTAEVPAAGGPLHGSLTTNAVLVEPGKTTSVKVHVYADVPSDARVKIAARNWEEFRGEKSTSGFSYRTPKDAAVGDTIELTVKAPAEDTMDIVVMFASPDGGTNWHFWPVVVTTSAGAASAGVQNAAASNAESARSRFAMPSHPKRFTKLGMLSSTRR